MDSAISGHSVEACSSQHGSDSFVSWSTRNSLLNCVH